MLYFVLATALLLGAFLLVYRYNRAQVLSGFMFLLFLLCGGLTAVLALVNLNNPVTNFIVVALAMLVLFVLLFGVYVLVAVLLLSASTLFKRERRSLANSLSLILALGIIGFMVVSAILGSTSPPLWVQCVWAGLIAVLVFYALHLALFLTTLALCCLSRPAKKQDYIVVLGSGLIEGKVPRLLAARIDKAIAFYHRQAAARPPPKLVMSGGQGPDEPRPEAEAMREYALEQHIPEEHILVECESASTAENMRFSKQVMDNNAAGTPYRSIFATNGYHLLRAGIYARRAGLPAEGIGARTAWYYRLNAMVREYIAFFWMHKVRLFVLMGLVFLAGVGFLLLPELLLSFARAIGRI